MLDRSGVVTLKQNQRGKDAKRLQSLYSGQGTRDYGTYERHKHDVIELIYVKDLHSRVARVMTQRWIDVYLAKKQITQKEFDVACSVYDLWRRTGMSPGLVASYKEHHGGKSVMSQQASDAFMQLWSALSRVGKSSRSVLINVCAWDMSATEWAECYGVSKRSGLAVLKLALRDIGEHLK